MHKDIQLTTKLTLNQAIENLQKSKGMSDQQFAFSLGVDPSTWSKIKNGHRPPGGIFIRRLSAAYPELRNAVMGYLSTPAESAQNQKSGGWLIRCWESFKRAFIYP